MANTNSYATAGTALNMASPMLNMVPYVGPLLSMGAGIAGGMLEKKAAQEQAAQAKKTRDEALGLKPDPVNQYFIQKYRADKAAALGGMPGYELAKNAIDTNIATGIRTGMESGASGAQRLALASALVGKGNQSLNQLAMQNAAITGELQEAARNDLGMLGTQANRQQDIRDKWKMYGLEGAAELEKAATYNKINAMNKILGAVTSTGQTLLNQAPEIGQLAGEQRIYDIKKKANEGKPLSESDMEYLQRYGISLDSLGLGNYGGVPSGFGGSSNNVGSGAIGALGGSIF